MTFAPIPEILAELKAGRPIVLVDDPDRENEGDLCFAAEYATPELVNMMAVEARGLVCLALDGAICDQLHLTMQAADNQSRFGTPFTVSIEAREGVTTGISAADRAKTILTAAHPDAKPSDLVRPGHIFPLRARDGGVLVRTGQTEGIVDLCRLAGLRPAGVICEIMNPDGTMSRVPQLEEFCGKHQVKMASIADLIEYRRRRERIVERVASAPMPTRFGDFDAHVYRSRVDNRTHVALCVGMEHPSEPDGRFPPLQEPVLVRVHSQDLTGEVFGSLMSPAGTNLEKALERLQQARRGVFLYITQGGGVGLAERLQLQQAEAEGLDRQAALDRIGVKPDGREFGVGAQILHDLGVRRMELLTSSPKKLLGLEGYGLEVVRQLALDGADDTATESAPTAAPDRSRSEPTPDSSGS